MNIAEENQAKAEQCIQVAEIAYADNNLDKAERFLKKAERFHPTNLAKKMLEDVRAAKNRQNDSNSRNENENETTEETVETKKEEYEYFRSEVDLRHAESCIVIAKLAMSKSDYDRAQRFLMKSNRLYPSKETDELLEQLAKLKLNGASSSYNGNHSYGCEDDAQKCVEVAQEEFAAGNLARAERILLKAERLFSTDRAKDLLKQIEDARARGQPDVGKPVESNRRPSVHKEEEKPKVVGPTPEQIEIVRKVMNSGDYEMFGIDERTPPDAVKRAYRRLAAQLHPDKNKAPGSREAFMAMREAFDRIKKLEKAKK